MARDWKKTFWNAVPFIVLTVVGFLSFEKVSTQFDWSQIKGALIDLDMIAVWWALGAAAISYMAMIGYDFCGMSYAQANLSFRRTVGVSFTAFAAANTLGFGAVSSGAVRYRLYTKGGLTTAQVAKMVSFVAVGFTMGILGLGAVAVLLDTEAIAPFFNMRPIWLGLIAGVIIGAILTLIISAGSGVTLKIRSYALTLPRASILVQLIPLTFLDLIAAGLCLWFLLPEGAIAFDTFLGIFIVSMALATLSHVPAGLGVFDAAIFFFLGGMLPTPDLAAALIVYRIVYYFIPFLLAVVVALFIEYRDFKGLSAAVRQKLHLRSGKRDAHDRSD